ncbi:MAG: hypothetical protein KIT31_18590 [Deltaproteobacteria bacterium]|nr:hypothetical protein [Deltaproteobacteria bacterium]
MSADARASLVAIAASVIHERPDLRIRVADAIASTSPSDDYLRGVADALRAGLAIARDRDEHDPLRWN